MANRSVELSKTPVGRVECYYLGYLGDREPLIRHKKEELARAGKKNDLAAVFKLEDEIGYIVQRLGSIELHDMHEIDYLEAIAAHPDDWAMADEYKLDTGPSVPKVIDMRNHPQFPTPESLKANGPPVMDAHLTMNQVKRKIRTGAAGAP